MNLMKKSTNLFLFIIIFFCALASKANAQIKGIVIDIESGDTIPSASVIYKGQKVSVAADEKGQFSIERHNGWTLTVKAVGYKSKNVSINNSTPAFLTVHLKPDHRNLDEVVVKSKRKTKYSRKDNPAVELMKRVIAAKKRTDLENHDFYQYNKYQKITLAINDVTPDDLEEARAKNKQWMVDQVEFCPYNFKLILPISVDETAIQHVYRKSPRSAKDIVKGQSSTGVNQFLETGNILNTLLKDVFTDVDIYDDQVRLLQYPFTSPIGKDAIGFYRFYIEDTVYVGQHLCYHLQFTPNNIQDFGFRGEIFVKADSNLHVTKCTLTVPQRSDVNFVESLRVEQSYTELPNGEWVLTNDDMVVELHISKLISNAVILRTTRLSDYDFEEIPNKLFKGKAETKYEADAKMKDDAFWEKYRTVELSNSESSMNNFMQRLQETKGFKYIMFGLKVLIENFVETGSGDKKSKVDIGPINTLISTNPIDGVRYRLSAQTTAALDPNWFLKGYYAYGRDTKNHYYKATATYSFNKKQYQPSEFPSQTLSFESSYDIMSSSDKFLFTDKDNVFTALKWCSDEQMYFYNRQVLKFDWETDWGFRTTVSMKTESNEPAGSLRFDHVVDGSSVNKLRTTEATLSLSLCPGRTYVNTKQHRIPVNFDAPEVSITHTMGFDGFLGGQYRYNYTEAGIYKRFWMNSWGKIDCHLKAGAEWNKVPFPLLIMPPSNLSYIVEEGTFTMMKNMEFLNDRFASTDISWDLNGKILNRIPLIKKLKWREIIGVKGLMGKLTDKNNPLLEKNANDPVLFFLPEDSYVMRSNRPYWEFMAGFHNIFKFFQVVYVRRLNYTDIPGTKKHGVRLAFEMTF